MPPSTTDDPDAVTTISEGAGATSAPCEDDAEGIITLTTPVSAVVSVPETPPTPTASARC